MCRECHRLFTSAGNLGRHLAHNPSHFQPVGISPSAGKPVRTRKRPTHLQKARVLADLKRLEEATDPPCVCPKITIRKWHQGYSKKNIQDWSRDRDQYFRAVAEGRGHMREIQVKSRVHFPVMENVLYMRFCWRRNVEGLKTSGLWLRFEMAEVLTEYKPNGWSTALCSEGWLAGFKKRYRISSQVRTNKKIAPIAERVPHLKKFHL